MILALQVPKFYFGSHLFRDPSSMREKLIEGLSQVRAGCMGLMLEEEIAGGE